MGDDHDVIQVVPGVTIGGFHSHEGEHVIKDTEGGLWCVRCEKVCYSEDGSHDDEHDAQPSNFKGVPCDGVAGSWMYDETYEEGFVADG